MQVRRRRKTRRGRPRLTSMATPDTSSHQSPFAASGSSAAHAEPQATGATNKPHLHPHDATIGESGLELGSASASGRTQSRFCSPPSAAASRGKRARPPRCNQAACHMPLNPGRRCSLGSLSELLGGRVKACGWEAGGERGSVNSGVFLLCHSIVRKTSSPVAEASHGLLFLSRHRGPTATALAL